MPGRLHEDSHLFTMVAEALYPVRDGVLQLRATQALIKSIRVWVFGMLPEISVICSCTDDETDFLSG